MLRFFTQVSVKTEAELISLEKLDLFILNTLRKN
jgi:hypothetical protein